MGLGEPRAPAVPPASRSDRSPLLWRRRGAAAVAGALWYPRPGCGDARLDRPAEASAQTAQDGLRHRARDLRGLSLRQRDLGARPARGPCQGGDRAWACGWSVPARRVLFLAHWCDARVLAKSALAGL